MGMVDPSGTKSSNEAALGKKKNANHMDQESSTKKKEISLGSALEKNRSGKKPAVTRYLWARKPDR